MKSDEKLPFLFRKIKELVPKISRLEHTGPDSKIRIEKEPKNDPCVHW